jgi:hypothetical protein
VRRDFAQREITELVGVEHGERRSGGSDEASQRRPGGQRCTPRRRWRAPAPLGIAERIRLTAKRTRRYPRVRAALGKVFLGDWHPVLRDPLDLFRLSFPVITSRGTGHAVHWQ